MAVSTLFFDFGSTFTYSPFTAVIGEIDSYLNS